MELNGKKALVTGASGGIGRGIAARLAEAGCDVAVHYGGNRKGAEETAEAARAAGADATILQADLRDPANATALADAARDALGAVDVLVNNAGVVDSRGDGRNGHKPFAERAGEWDRVVNVNLRAPFLLAARLAPEMKARGGGAIVNVASVAGWYALNDVPLYSLTKSGLLHLTRQLALEYAPEVRVNAVAPGWIPTDFGWGHLGTDQFRDAITKTIPMQRMGAVEEIAEAVHFLVAKADYTTGQALGADGGLGATLR